jgi:hypothetical protein
MSRSLSFGILECIGFCILWVDEKVAKGRNDVYK